MTATVYGRDVTGDWHREATFYGPLAEERAIAWAESGVFGKDLSDVVVRTGEGAVIWQGEPPPEQGRLL